MKIITKYLLILFCLNIYSCRAQVRYNLQKQVFIIKDSIKCNNEISFFVFPDVLAKNESNFFNNVIAKDYINYLGTEKNLLKPKDFVKEAITLKKTNCNNNNFSGLANSTCVISFNNLNIVSIIMNYESLAGNLSTDTYYYNFNIKNSKILGYKDVLKEEKLNILLNIGDKILRNRLKNLFTEEKDNLSDSDRYKLLSNSKKIFKQDNLHSFIIKENGIEFLYSYGFNKGEYDIEDNLFFSFKDLEIFLKDDFRKKLK